MSLHRDLLLLANRLTGLEQRRPRQASLRRAVSTAYYALFHLLTDGATRLLAPRIHRDTAHRMQRWFAHADMKRVCVLFSATTPEPIGLYLQGTLSIQLRTVAQAFVKLQAARHEADYDLRRRWTRSEALEITELAGDAFNAWAEVRRSHDANIFALALLSPRLFDRER